MSVYEKERVSVCTVSISKKASRGERDSIKGGMKSF